MSREEATVRTFIDSLPENLEGVDFRVLAPEGGYRELVNDVVLEGSTSLEILAVHLSQEMSFFVHLRVYVDRSTLAVTGPEVRFEHSPMEILTSDGEPSGIFVDSDLTVHLDVVRDGLTAGTLRMRRPTTAVSLLTETE
jgi:hypothetical protein